MIERKTERIVSHVVLAVVSAMCLLPLLLMFIASISAESSIVRKGYSFFPAAFSLSAYRYLAEQSSVLGRAYALTIGTTVFGTAASLVVTTLLAYPLSRLDLPHRKALTFAVVLTMLFNGGLVPTYLVYTQFLHIKNTIWALLIPGLLLNGFNVLIMRTFFVNTIPPALMEAARIDGAGEFRTLWAVVLPLSYPILATIGLFSAIAYWNNWYTGLIYLSDPKLFNIQNILNRILQDVQFLSSTDLGSNASAQVAKIPSITVRMAIATVGTLPILIAYPFFQKYFIKGIAVGAVKG